MDDRAGRPVTPSWTTRRPPAERRAFPCGRLRPSRNRPSRIELTEPAAVPADRAVDGGERRTVPVDLVLPDGDVLGELQVGDPVVELGPPRGVGSGQGLHREVDGDLGQLLVDRGLGDVGEHVEGPLAYLDGDDSRPAGGRDAWTSNPASETAVTVTRWSTTIVGPSKVTSNGSFSGGSMSWTARSATGR